MTGDFVVFSWVMARREMVAVVSLVVVLGAVAWGTQWQYHGERGHPAVVRVNRWTGARQQFRCQPKIPQIPGIKDLAGEPSYACGWR